MPRQCGIATLLLKDTYLTKAGHPILCVPGTNNSPIFKFVDIDHLNVYLSVLRRKAHEWLFLSAGHSGTDDHLVPVLEVVLDCWLEIRKGRGELRGKGFDTGGPHRR